MLRPTNVPNIIPSGTVLNANRTSSAEQLLEAFAYSIQVVISGTPTGTLKLQASCDPVSSGGFSVAPSNWTDISGSSVAVSAAGSQLWNYADPGYNWVRVVYTDGSSGASTATVSSCTFNSKGF